MNAPTCPCGHVVYDHSGWLYDCSHCACTGPGLPGMVVAKASGHAALPTARGDSGTSGGAE